MSLIKPGRIPPVANSPDKIQLARLSHVYASHPNLDDFHEFAKDFGFFEEAREHGKVYYRGYGRDMCCYVATRSNDGGKHFDGAAYIAKTEQDFLKAAGLNGGSPISHNPGPCGGRVVSLSSPSGTKIHVLWGVRERPEPKKAISATEVQRGDYNKALEKNRKGSFTIAATPHEGVNLTISAHKVEQGSFNDLDLDQPWSINWVITAMSLPCLMKMWHFIRRISTLSPQIFCGRR
jgi:hypothetical protein